MQKKYLHFCQFSVEAGEKIYYVTKFFLFSLTSAVLLTLPNLALSQTITNSPFFTYENPELGIKIDYPVSWQRAEGSNPVGSAFFVRFSSPYESNFDTLQETLEIHVVFLPFQDVYTLEYFIFEPPDESDPRYCGGFLACAQLEKTNFNVIELSPTQVANNPAYKVVYTETVMIDGVPHEYMDMYVVVLKGDRVYSIEYYAEPTTYFNYLPTIESMLNSFQITF